MFSIFRSEAAVASLRTTWEQSDAALRSLIEQASYHIDQLLQHDPLDQGESREPGTRILFLAPLAVLFEVDEAQRLVRILRSWAYGVSSGPGNCLE